ncbi:CPBP family intramembrane glutamic endopeptidase [Calothrix sp. 336/3]|uniref:CPBP family intramembrane glutamic endopeptidase n=1 Tax=Calothrix sp. 336/3 TaxID=1337936 RepID=UPI0004E436FA|nr:CPBP family glutamic-type intramembrane protease [Calothrix sp. 336/3]AKG22593.1 abortive phage infection protein [Calothrix sp. 336/3]
MTIKRLLTILLTLVAILYYGQALYESWQKPQIQSRLELYQTDILLQAQEWQPEGNDAENSQQNWRSLKTSLLGTKPLVSATKQYQDVRDSAEKTLEKLNQQAPVDSQQMKQSVQEVDNLITELDLRLGVLQAEQKQTEVAVNTWKRLQARIPRGNPGETGETAAALAGMWSNPPSLLPNAQPLIQKNLEGWFRLTALERLYELQQRSEAVSEVVAQQQEAGEQAVVKLAIVATLPGITGLLGLGLLIFVLGQRLIKGKNSLLAQNEDIPWQTPWDGETTLQVYIFGFFFIGQILVGQFVMPILVSILPFPRPITDVRIQAFFVFLSYLIVASGAIAVLFATIKPYFPLSPDWFRFQLRSRWFLWGLGGYCAALPIVVIISLVNQKFWQGQGGSNPLLQLVLSSHSNIALFLFFFTAAIAAPVFEEFLFRGFLLPSLTRYMSVWGAILISSLVFAVAHLSLSEILPLFALGVVLGVVYTRSRNLLASMLLHSLWNSGTLLSLFVLGSSNQ